MKFWIPALFLVAFVFAVACDDENTLSANNVVTAIPWSVPETTNYVVLDQRGNDIGTLEMTIEGGSGHTLELRQFFEFPETGFTNESIVVVDAGTLVPQSTNYVLIGPDGQLSCEAEYDSGTVTAHRQGEDGERTDEISAPRLSYDSWADLFLWRTMSFTRGYAISYSDVLSCTLDRTQNIGVTLTVKDRETITVPAGEIETWHVEIQSGGETQHAWYANDRARTLVRYDNGSQVFELVAS